MLRAYVKTCSASYWFLDKNDVGMYGMTHHAWCLPHRPPVSSFRLGSLIPSSETMFSFFTSFCELTRTLLAKGCIFFSSCVHHGPTHRVYMHNNNYYALDQIHDDRENEYFAMQTIHICSKIYIWWRIVVRSIGLYADESIHHLLSSWVVRAVCISSDRYGWRQCT